jgi:hypothetical protein
VPKAHRGKQQARAEGRNGRSQVEEGDHVIHILTEIKRTHRFITLVPEGGDRCASARISVPTFAGTTAAIGHRGLAVQYLKRNPAVVEMLLFTKKLFDNPPLNSVQKQPM